MVCLRTSSRYLNINDNNAHIILRIKIYSPIYMLYINILFEGISDIGNWYGASNRHVITFSTNQGKHQSNTYLENIEACLDARVFGQRITFESKVLMLGRKWKSRVQHQIHLTEDLRWDLLFMRLIFHILQKFGSCIRDGLMVLSKNFLDRFAIKSSKWPDFGVL